MKLCLIYHLTMKINYRNLMNLQVRLSLEKETSVLLFKPIAFMII